MARSVWEKAGTARKGEGMQPEAPPDPPELSLKEVESGVPTAKATDGAPIAAAVVLIQAHVCVLLDNKAYPRASSAKSEDLPPLA